MLKLSFAPIGPPRPPAPFVPPPGMRLQEYVLAYDEGRKRTVYLAAHDHGAAFGDAYLFDGKGWTQVAKGSTVFATSQKLFGFYDEARAGVAAWSFAQDFQANRFVATGLLLDVRDGLAPIAARGDAPIAEPDGGSLGTFDYEGLFANDPRRAVTVCLTRRGVWELDADAIWRKRAALDAWFPMDWDDDGAGAAYDPIRKHTVFWIYTRAPRREYAFFAWNGRALSRLGDAGLPMDRLHIGLFDPAALVSSHPSHGLVLFAGSHGAFAFDGAAWRALPAQSGEVPPRMKNARMVFDANAGGLVAGPGYHEGDPGGRAQQRVFYVEKNGTWTQMGEKSVPSRLKELAPEARHARVGGAWIAIATGSLCTLREEDGDWVEVVSKHDGAAALGGEHAEALVEAGERALVVTGRGAVLAGDGSGWTRERDAYRPFSERSDFCAAWDAKNERLVVFGGSVRDRATSDTFFYSAGAWRAAKERARDPAGEFSLVFDGALQRVIRLGEREVAFLDGERWVPVAPERYADARGLAVHDPSTGETLLVSLARGKIARFDLAECAEVAEIEASPELARALSFDPVARVLHAQDPDERSRRVALDLGPAFDAARGLGPRTPITAMKPPVRLYHPEKRTFWFLDGDIARSGTLGETREKIQRVARPGGATAAKRKAGFVPASELSLEALAAIGARESRTLSIGKPRKGGKTAISRVGGLPSGDFSKRWPKRGKERLGFLLQIDCRGFLRKHAGVAVFCATDGTATWDPARNAAVLLRAADWKKKPGPAPDGVAKLPVRPIALAERRPEIDEERVRALGESDAAVAAAFDRLREIASPAASASKLGGAPVFRASPEEHAKYTFLAQVDFDGIDQDWGLAGCLYVLVDAAEKRALAFWQRS